MTGYPRFKLKNETELAPYFHTIPYFHIFYRLVNSRLGWDLQYRDKMFFDNAVKRVMPDCDIFMGIAASFLESAKVAREKGASVIVDRPCSHIEEQDRLMLEEAKREGVKLKPIDPRVVSREIKEYEFADLITVPSAFAARSFYARGFTTDKIRVIPYGIDLRVFHPVGEPEKDEFNVLFVGQLSLRKGIGHLLRAFDQVKHPRKKLRLIGSILPEVSAMVYDFASRMPVEIFGHMPQPMLKEYMSRSHVFVLPSIEDGYGLVMSQSMACGSPVIATENTGGEMLITEGVEGFIVPPADDEALRSKLQTLADNPELRDKMSTAAIKRVEQMAGWSSYCDKVVEMFEELRS